MAHDVFLSHSPEDQVVAGYACATLQQRGITCLLAPETVRDARVLVVIFSEHSNGSSDLRRDLEDAAHFNIPVVPFRIVNIAPAEELEPFFARSHWIDAFALSPQQQFEMLHDEIAKYLQAAPAIPPPLPLTPAVGP
jgi:hypothetical protein